MYEIIDTSNRISEEELQMFIDEMKRMEGAGIIEEFKIERSQ